MLALRLTRSAHPAVQLRRLAVATASAATGFLLLSTLGHALTHPDASTASVLRLTWCVVPLTTTVWFALAVARTDPGTRPRPGLGAIGLGPARLMAVSATTTALSTLLGSMLSLFLFLHLRGDLTGMPFDGAATGFLAAGRPLPLPAALTLLSLAPVTASTAVALMLRPRDTRVAARTTSARAAQVAQRAQVAQAVAGEPADAPPPPPTDRANGSVPNPIALPWGAALLAAGLAVESYASRTAGSNHATLPTGLPDAPTTVLLGWTLTALGLALAGPGLTHLCGRLLQAIRPGALRLLAGRGLMQEASRIGRPLGVVCAVASGAYAVAALYDPQDPASGPLTTLGALVVAGCTVATLLTAAVEARQARADTTAALLRLGAPGRTLRTAAALRAGAILALFAPLTLLVAELAALPLAQ